MLAWRLILAVLGIAGLLYGLGRLFTEISLGTLIGVGTWLIAIVIIHDGVVSPLIIGVGALLDRLVPPRARSFIQGGLIMAGMVTVIAIPMIIKQGTNPPVKALLEQNYGRSLGMLFGLIAAVCLVGYAIRVARDHRPAADASELASADS